MCGIVGIFGIKDKSVASQLVQKMNDAISHRGPDDQGVYADDTIALGHRRLAILDLSPAGHQPMHSADDNLEIVFNGEIYNFLEIREKITGYPFKTRSDTEVILAAYQKWGKECVHQFNGMFAFAIWDKTKKQLFIARDRLGIKPVYYFRNGNEFYFASEIRALLASGRLPRKINKNALGDYFMYQTVHAPATIIENVFMLMPGHCIIADDTQFKIEKYWDIIGNKSRASEGKNYAQVCKDVQQFFEAAVKRRLISDVPFGAFLSGGIDSSAVVGLMSKVQQQPVKTFNISFDESEFSEAKYARIISEKFHTDHKELKLTPADFLKQLPDALKALDHPSGDGPNSYIVSKITRENGITMALSGLGGDELFAGYPVFNRSLDFQNKKWIWQLPMFLRKTAGSLAALVKPGIIGEKYKQLMELPSAAVKDTFPVSRQISLPESIQRLLNVPAKEDAVANIVGNVLEGNEQLGVLSQVSAAEISTYMQNILLRDTDQMSMASALEVRVPFLDYELVEYVMGIKDEFKNPLFPKKLLVDSMGDLLPDEIVHRKKMGFTFPWQHWLKNELKEFCNERIQSLSKRNFMNGKEVIDRWNRFLQGDPGIRWPDIWICVVLENWLLENQIEN